MVESFECILILEAGVFTNLNLFNHGRVDVFADLFSMMRSVGIVYPVHL